MTRTLFTTRRSVGRSAQSHPTMPISASSAIIGCAHWDRQRRTRRQSHDDGFTYLGVLFLVGLLSLTATMAAVVPASANQRERERDLVFAGHQYMDALNRYHAAFPGHVKRWPSRLEDLLQDDRTASTLRHLRRIYVDPMTQRAQWGLIRLPDGSIVGVHSLSERRPLDRARVSVDFAVPSTRSYREWRFMAEAAASTPMR